jgi:hypothetical protein
MPITDFKIKLNFTYLHYVPVIKWPNNYNNAKNGNVTWYTDFL